MEFNCREIVYTTITYSKSQYANLDIAEEIKNWKEELESNSSARPVLLGSPFDDEDGNMSLDIDIDGEIDPETIYVVLYYYYEDASYSTSDDVSEGWSVCCDPVLAELDIACAMESATDGDNTEYFECISSSDRTETMLAIYQGTDLLVSGEVDELLN